MSQVISTSIAKSVTSTIDPFAGRFTIGCRIKIFSASAGNLTYASLENFGQYVTGPNLIVFPAGSYPIPKSGTVSGIFQGVITAPAQNPIQYQWLIGVDGSLTLGLPSVDGPTEFTDLVYIAWASFEMIYESL